MSAIIFDTECTDLDDPEIVEAAWIRLTQDKGLFGDEPDRIPTDLDVAGTFDTFEQRFKPERRELTTGAVAVHGILPSELEGCPPSSTFALPDVKFLIGHNCDYDYRAAGSPETVRRICTDALSRHVFPDANHYSLVALTYALNGLTPETRELVRGAHGALQDCRLTLLLLRHILAAKPEITTWSALWEFSEDCRIPLKMTFTDARGTLITEIDDGLLDWCLSKSFVPVEHPYLYKALVRESERRQEEYYQELSDKARDKHDPDPECDEEDDEIPF